MKLGSLFSGYGGLEMSVNNVLGSETAWVSDVDKGANKILAHRYPGVPNLGDITTVDWSTVEPVDILTGGSPCQDLSHAGKRGGMTEGTRSNLWVAMREAIAQLRPSLVIWENVRGAYSADASSDLEFCAGCMGDTWDREPVLRALGRVLGDLADLGFDAEWTGLRAADIGAPHGRFRVFVVAYPASDSGRFQHGDGATATDARERGRGRWTPELAGSPDHVARSGTRLGTLLPTPAVNDMGEGKTVEAWDKWTAKMQAAHGNGNGHGKSLSIEAQRLFPTPTVGDSGHQTTEGYDQHVRRYLERNPHLNVGNVEMPLSVAAHAIGTKPDTADLLPAVADRIGISSHQWGQYADAIARWEALTRPAPAPTQPSKKGTPQLSAAFSEWLMGLPAGWVTDVPGITRNEALKALGNGVVPQQAEAALRAMLTHLEVAA